MLHLLRQSPPLLLFLRRQLLLFFAALLLPLPLLLASFVPLLLPLLRPLSSFVLPLLRPLPPVAVVLVVSKLIPSQPVVEVGEQVGVAAVVAVVMKIQIPFIIYMFIKYI
jgi:hypothetical protein